MYVFGECKSEKLISMILSVDTDDLDSASKFLQATGWDLSTAQDLWLALDGDARTLPASDSTVSVVDPDGDSIISSPTSGCACEEKNEPPLFGLFREPEYKFNGDWEEARVSASEQSKWILVNIQSTEYFASHCLNRDLWNDFEFGEFVSNSFVFYQLERASMHAAKLIKLYDISTYPSLCVIDPVDGHKVGTINVPPADKFPGYAQVIRERLMSFLELRSDSDGKERALMFEEEDSKSVCASTDDDLVGEKTEEKDECESGE
jgi:hypothetical protein